MPEPATLTPPAGAALAPPGELEVRRRVERLFARELADPSEELVRFVSARLELGELEPTAAERTAELCRRALREMGRERWRTAGGAGGRLLLDRRQLDRRRFEQRALPGYYLG